MREIAVEGGVGSGAGALQRGRRIAGAGYALWWREVVRFLRQRSRVVGGLAQPLVFWLLLGGGFHMSFRPPGLPQHVGYVTYFYPGVLLLVLLFTAIFATISVVEDRQAGFLQGVLVAPVGRGVVVLGQALGCATLAWGQGLAFLAFAPLAGIPLGPAAIALTAAVLALLAFALANLGLVIAWRLDTTQGFHAIMNLVLIPLWLLSGAPFPAAGAARWLRWTIAANPLSYGMAALRRALYWQHPALAGAVPGFWPALTVLLALAGASFGAVVFAAGRAGR